MDNANKGATVLEEMMQTANFEVMPDGYIHLYNHLNDVYTVSKTLTDSGLVIEHLSQNGDSLESYFSKVIGGEPHA